MNQILKHKLVEIIQDEVGYRLFIATQEGGWVEHNPFPNDLRGLVGAMMIATDVLAGKFWLKSALMPGRTPVEPDKYRLTQFGLIEKSEFDEHG